MAMAHTQITFSYVSIPISLYKATQDNDISFNQLHKEDNHRIRIKKVCEHCGQEVSSTDIIKGYEINKNQYITISNEDLEKIKSEKDKTIRILHFIDYNQISPVYFNTTYHAIPETGGYKAFELLRAALMDEQKIAIGTATIDSKQSMLAIIPQKDGLLIQTLFYEDKVKSLPISYEKPDFSAQEMIIEKALINSINTPFNPASYKDEYQTKLREIIEAKIAYC